MRIGVVGGGLFGCTAAVYAARSGHDVHLFEAKPSLMSGATAGTYSRLHRGAHYPRSVETGRESRRAEKSFRAEYGAAIIDGGRQLYVVPPKGSHVSADEFAAFLDDEGLSFLREGNLFRVTEPRINLAGLQTLVRQKVTEAGVKVHFNARASYEHRDDFDWIVVAAYAGLNDVMFSLGGEVSEYRYQVVERPVVLLPEAFKDTSIVVLDGPYGCVDPLDDTPLHVIGHVTETIHASNTGYGPDVPKHLVPLLDRGIIRNPPHTRFREAVTDLARYIPGVGKAVHVGSSFVVRAVMAHQEPTDARPTLVHRADEQVIRVFSGKLGTACRAAQEVVALVGAKQPTHREQVAA